MEATFTVDIETNAIFDNMKPAKFVIAVDAAGEYSCSITLTYEDTEKVLHLRKPQVIAIAQTLIAFANST